MAAYFAMPILIIDDNRTMIHIVRKLLTQIGYTDVEDVSDGPSALARIAEKKFNLMISDWNMEPMTGYELLKQVRANPEFARIRFILITAEVRPDHVIAAKKAGADNYLIKPFTAETLKEKIE